MEVSRRTTVEIDVCIGIMPAEHQPLKSERSGDRGQSRVRVMWREFARFRPPSSVRKMNGREAVVSNMDRQGVS